ncbi:hypothetical protein ATCC90586_010222 [Pythium insidiosum]|nr:hypothetical protein ATCC90586_010222 [Pythium insidiosum]
MALFAASIGELQLGAHNSMMELFHFISSPIFGLMGASVTRMGSHLGAGNAARARLVGWIAGCLIAALCAITGTGAVLYGRHLGYIFSDDPAVIDIFKRISAYGAVAYLILSVFCYAVIILEAQARSIPIMIAFFAGAWVVGVPSAYFLGVHNGVKSIVGVWQGMLLGYVGSASIAFGVVTCGTDWELQARLAMERSTEEKEKLAEQATLLLPQ